MISVKEYFQRQVKKATEDGKEGLVIVAIFDAIILGCQKIFSSLAESFRQQALFEVRLDRALRGGQSNTRPKSNEPFVFEMAMTTDPRTWFVN